VGRGMGQLAIGSGKRKKMDKIVMQLRGGGLSQSYGIRDGRAERRESTKEEKTKEPSVPHQKNILGNESKFEHGHFGEQKEGREGKNKKKRVKLG